MPNCPKEVFWEISLTWFLSTYCTLSFPKVWNKFFEQILRYRLVQFWAIIWPKLPNCPIEVFWEISLTWILSTYCTLSMCKIWKKKILRVDPEVSASIIMGQNWTKIADLAQIEFFGKFHRNDFFSLKWFLSSYCLLTCCKIWKDP